MHTTINQHQNKTQSSQNSQLSIESEQKSDYRKVTIPQIFREKFIQSFLPFKSANNKIAQLARFTQDKAYLVYNSNSNQQYLKFLLQYNNSIPQNDKQAVKLLVADRQFQIKKQLLQNVILLGKKKIPPKTKKQLQQKQRQSIQNILKTKDASIRAQLQQIQQSIASIHIQQQNDSRKIKKVKKFVYDLKKQKQERRKAHQERSIRQNLKKHKQQQEKQMQIKLKKEKQNKKWNDYHQKRQIQRKQYGENLQIKKKQFNKYFSQYKKIKPLFISKQQQQKTRVQRQQKQFQKQLQIIKKQYQPLDFQAITQHQKKYLSIKQQFSNRRSQQRKLNVSTLSVQKQYYRGKYHQLQQQQAAQPQTNNKQIGHRRLEKHRQYQQLVKNVYRPSISQRKRKELQKLIQKQKLKAQNFIRPAKDATQLGHQYLEAIRKMKKKPKSQISTIDIQPRPIIQKKKDYLAQMRQKGNRSVKLRQPNWEKQFKQSNVHTVQRIMQSLQPTIQKCKRYEHRIKIEEDNLQLLGLKSDLETQYLKQIKVKMEILKAKNK